MENLTRKSVISQQGSIQKRAQSTDCYRIFNLLTSDGLLDKIEAGLPEHRERLFPPTETLSMFVTQALSADRSCQNMVNQAALHRLLDGLPLCSSHTGGYCRARQRLPLNLVRDLARYVSQTIEHQVADDWHWQGRKVKIVDGTTLSMPDTEANQARYPQQKGQQPGLGFPVCRLVGITSLASGALLDAAIGPYKGKGSDEKALLRTLQDGFESGDIVLGDAFFPTYFLIGYLQAKGVDILMEQNSSRRKSTDFRRGEKLGQRDHIVTFDKPKKKPDWMSEEHYLDAPDSIRIREFKAGGKIMVTTLMNPKVASKQALKLLYQKRWNVELDIRDIKTTMGMDILSCKTADMVVKEIWVYLLAYNLIRLMMTQSAKLADIKPRDMSFKHSLQLWLIWLQQPGDRDQQSIHLLLSLAAQQRVGNRPGRIEPRAVKRRPKHHLPLKQMRHLARSEIAINGHPKIVK